MQKNKLPNIYRKDDLPTVAAFKKQRRKIHSTSNKSKEESTKVEESFSYMLENRPMKMYSHHEKNVRAVEFTAERIKFNSNVEI